MPASKDPVVHKFGIISPSHRVQLQKRLAEKTRLLTKNEHHLKASRNPLEFTDEFIQLYNTATGQTKREKLELKAVKLLEKLKRQCGLRDCGVGSHVDLITAWTELIQLSQCKGNIQQDCLDVLLVSLDQSPTAEDHVLALFFLAESVLYLLRTDVIYEQFLNSLEVRLLLIGERVFARLFFHHMCGHMTDHTELKQRLHTYLNGFLDSQKIYEPYPHLLCYVRFISSAGNIIVSDAVSGQKKEAKKKVDNPVENRTEDISKSVERIESSVSTSLSSSMHELAPTLWHSLDVWRCACHLSSGLQQALSATLESAAELNVENWIDAVCAMEILGSAARVNLDTLSALQHIACGTTEKQSTTVGDNLVAESVVISSPESQLRPLLPAIRESDLSFQSNARSEASEKSQSHLGSAVHESTQSPTGDKLDSAASSLLSNRMTEAVSSGLPSWRWELALKYVDILTHIAMHGSTSEIRRQALMGNNSETDYIHRLASIVRAPLLSAGLFDLLFFRTVVCEEDKECRDDWSWRVRFFVFLSLSKIHFSLTKGGAALGIRTVIWKMLEKARLLETELQVLEALKVVQIDVNLETLLHDHLHTSPGNLGSKIAQGLSHVYLPPLPPLSGRLPAVSRAQGATFKDLTPRKSHRQTEDQTHPLRTSLRDEILLANLLHRPSISYEERTDEDLKTMIKDQWRKEFEEKAKDELEVRFKTTG